MRFRVIITASTKAGSTLTRVNPIFHLTLKPEQRVSIVTGYGLEGRDSFPGKDRDKFYRIHPVVYVSIQRLDVHP